MNAVLNPAKFLESTAHVDEAAVQPLPNSRKIYVQGNRADIQVPMREISQSDTPTGMGGEKNPPIYVYDTSGPYTDPKVNIDIRSGLAPLREKWITERDDTELPTALAQWTPTARQVCEDFDHEPPFQEDPPTGCKRIDVLFNVDGSGSMTAEQAALRGTDGMAPVFAEFTDALLAELTEVEDFHVGVVSPQEGVTLLGTHRDFPETPESPETDCGVPPGQRWLVGPSPTLAEDFACIASTRSGTDEVTAYNTAEALHDPNNAGFLRDDSLVFVVMLTDEDTHDQSLARMVDIRTRMLDAVGGDLSRLVVLGIAANGGTFEAPKSVCSGPYGKAAPARRLGAIIGSLRERGVLQDICGGDLASSFTGVLDDVVSACQAFEPVP